jgi:hypothetical protein
MNSHRNWDETFDMIQHLMGRSPARGDPPSDLPPSKRIFIKGVPFKGHFTCSLSKAIPIRLAYDNHLVVKKNHAAVKKKFEKEERNPFTFTGSSICLKWPSYFPMSLATF